jgi:hypothetical protein
MRFGQISVSTSTSSEGFRPASARRTDQGRSRGLKKTPSAARAFRASAFPVAVVVDTITRREGKRALSASTRPRATRTSPTETA